MIYPVILSGGSGTRLWPLSTPEKPKQFLSLFSEKSLLQETVLRCKALHHAKEPMIIGNVNHRDLIANQLQAVQVKSSAIVLEPIGRNTAPAIAIAAMQALKGDKSSLLFVMTSDHLIPNQKIFSQMTEVAEKQANLGKLVTFGIVPIHPETGYGYIRRGKNISENVFAVDAFVEKPNIEKADEYLTSGEYYWNSGMFLFSAKRYLEELGKFAPDILSVCKTAFEKNKQDKEFIFLDETSFKQCRSDSVDYAVMEKTNDAAVVPLDAGWTDIGSWKVVAELSPKDENGNTLIGDIKIINVKNAYIRAEAQSLQLSGIHDVIIIENNGKIVILDKNASQDVKHFAN